MGGLGRTGTYLTPSSSIHKTKKTSQGLPRSCDSPCVRHSVPKTRREGRHAAASGAPGSAGKRHATRWPRDPYQCTPWEGTCASQPSPGGSWPWTSRHRCYWSPSCRLLLLRSRAAACEASSAERHQVAGHLWAWTGCWPAVQGTEPWCWRPVEELLSQERGHTRETRRMEAPPDPHPRE